jgi:hypothetical protein
MQRIGKGRALLIGEPAVPYRAQFGSAQFEVLMLTPAISDGVFAFRVGNASFGGLALDFVAPPGVLVD